MGLWGKIKNTVNKVINAGQATVGTVINTAEEVGYRVIGAVDFGLSVAGLEIPKMMRIQVHILRDANGPVVGLAEVESWYKEAIRIYKERANISIRGASLYVPNIRILDDQAPDYVLNINGDFKSEYFGRIDAYFNEKSEVTHTSTGGIIMDAVGYGESIHVFVISSYTNCGGYSYGFTKDHVIVTRDAKLSSIAHEVGHQCGLPHSDGERNLMNPHRLDPGDELNRLQIAIIRDSRYSTFLNDGG